MERVTWGSRGGRVTWRWSRGRGQRRGYDEESHVGVTWWGHVGGSRGEGHVGGVREGVRMGRVTWGDHVGEESRGGEGSHGVVTWVGSEEGL